MRFECCVETLESAHAAVKGGGCRRLELCAALAEGGTTPSFGLFKLVRDSFPTVFVGCLVRPRGGDFYYSEKEVCAMLVDIDLFKRHGANGVVLGALDLNGAIHLSHMRRLISAARPMEVTFHRAIDVCRDPLHTVRECVALGVNRILSSGGESNALAGSATLAKMVCEADNRLMVCAGGGITPDNCLEISNS
ncbi:hypothetical protein BASA81_015604 [Batrachochytrium salamandrivorans]|nr:hypothetical protein BASA81_015604 [Batrachochytrium salamandrivorans]